jgi:hypothetical protein
VIEAKSSAVSEQIINKAISLGASLAGIASLDLLKKSLLTIFTRK